MLIPCWSIPQIMSHLMRDRVELSLHLWLENSFSMKPQKWDGPQWRNNSVWRWHVTQYVHVYWHPWVTASGVRFSPGTTARKENVCWNVLKICGLSILSLSKEQKAKEYELFLQVSFEMACFMMCTEDTYHQWTSTMSTFLGIKKNYFYF